MWICIEWKWFEMIQWMWFHMVFSCLIHWGTSELDLSLAGVSDAWRVPFHGRSQWYSSWKVGIAPDMPYLTHHLNLCFWKNVASMDSLLTIRKFGVCFRSPKSCKTFRWKIGGVKSQISGVAPRTAVRSCGKVWQQLSLASDCIKDPPRNWLTWKNPAILRAFHIFHGREGADFHHLQCDLPLNIIVFSGESHGFHGISIAVFVHWKISKCFQGQHCTTWPGHCQPDGTTAACAKGRRFRSCFSMWKSIGLLRNKIIDKWLVVVYVWIYIYIGNDV